MFALCTGRVQVSGVTYKLLCDVEKRWEPTGGVQVSWLITDILVASSLTSTC